MPRELLGNFENEDVKKACLKYAGPFFNEMAQSFQATREYLKHASPQARLGALAMMRDYWNHPPDFAQLCESVIRSDPDPDVRCMGLNCLIGCYYGTGDTRLCKWLAGMIRDEQEPLLVRKLAYVVLKATTDTAEPLQAHTLRFPEQVDWAFVARFTECGVEIDRRGAGGLPDSSHKP